MSENIESELESKLKACEEKMNNQADELNHLTNEVIVKLKKDNLELKNLKLELSDALEKSTKKYYSQLDINADLSDNLAKTGADLAVAKVRVDKLETEIKKIKEDAYIETAEIKEKLIESNPEAMEKLKNENDKLKEDLKEKSLEIEKNEESTKKLKSEIDDLRKNLIEIGNYKEKVDSDTKNNIIRLKNHISTLEEKLLSRQSTYDKLYHDSQKTIKDLETENQKLKKALNKHTNRSFIERLSNKPIELDEN